MQTSSSAGETPNLSPTTLLFRWAQYDFRPRLIIDQCLRVHWANRAANEELERQAELVERHGRLVVTDASHREAFRQFLEGVTAELSAFCFPCSEGEGHIIISAQELAGAKSDRFLGLMFRRAGRRSRSISTVLDQAFELTPAEIRVLQAMVDGNTVEEISHDQNTSVSTIRTHIKNIYAKLDVRSREALFHKVRPFIVTD